MTLVLCHWPERPAHGKIQVWADTRVSGQLGAVTDAAPKIFAIPTLVRSSRDRLDVRRATYGFAYSGSTLVANSVHALAITCLSSLSAKGRARPPSVEAVGDLYRRLSERYSREICSTVDFFVIGHCGRDRCFKLYRYSPQTSPEGVAMICREIDLKPGRYWALGSGELRFPAYAEGRQGELSDKLRDFIAAEVDPTVGGRLQAGVCSPDGFSLPLVMERLPGQNVVSTSFVGIDTAEIGRVDDLDVGTHALGPMPPPEILAQHYAEQMRPRNVRRLDKPRATRGKK